MRRQSKPVPNEKKKKAPSKAQQKQDQLIENLQTHYKKQRQLEIALEQAEQLEKNACPFSPSVNQRGRRFNSNQKLFESLHQLARTKQQFEEDQQYFQSTYKL